MAMPAATDDLPAAPPSTPIPLETHSFGTTMCRCIMARITRPTDDIQTRHRKQTMFTNGATLLCLAALGHAIIGDTDVWFTATCFATYAWSVTTLVLLLWLRVLPVWYIEGTVLYLPVFVVMPLDISALLWMTPRWYWAFSVILLWCLVLKVRRGIIACVLGEILGYMGFIAGEMSAGFGLRDTADVNPSACDCAAPPCDVSLEFTVTGLLTAVASLALVYATASEFAAAEERKREQLTASVTMAERIAECLSAFDLDAAEDLLNDSVAAKLPPTLQETFARILSNLRLYRPYLPASCLPQPQDIQDTVSIPENEHANPLSPPSEVSDPSARSASPNHQQGLNPNMLGAWPTGSMEFQGSFSVSSRLNTSHHSSNSSSESGSHGFFMKSASSFGPSLRRLGHPLRHKRVTLVHCNVHHTHVWTAERPDAVIDAFAAVIGQADVVFGKRGTLDLFLGETVHVAYNSSRICARHATAAVAACREYYAAIMGCLRADVTLAVHTGEIVCGDLGSKATRRFTYLGNGPDLARGCERIGRALGYPMVCNSLCMMDAYTDHEIRQLPLHARFARRCPGVRVVSPVPAIAELGEEVSEVALGGNGEACGAPGTASVEEHVVDGKAALYEIVPACDCDGSVRRGASEGEEWMYQLNRSAPAQWTAYNDAIKGYLNGRAAADVLAVFPKGHPKEALLRSVLAATPQGIPAYVQYL